MLSSKEQILDIEKDIFSELQSNFSQFINTLKKTNKISNDSSTQIILLNNKINEINSILIDVKYTISSKNNKKKNKKIIKELKEYDANDKIIRKCLPYMMYLKNC
jgi:hypothetical protein